MHRYDELERLYYRKKIIKIFFIIFIFILIIVGGFFIKKYFFSKNDISVQSAEKNPKYINIKKENNFTKKIIKKTDKEFKKETKKQQNVPMLSFVVPNMQSNKILEKKKEKINKNLKKEKVQQAQKKSVTIKKEKTQQIQKKVITPIIKEEIINIKQLIKKFNVNPKYDNAMIISNYFFNKNDFKNAKLWALKANSINPKRYESWKMFAMILLKKHKNKKAKEVLQTYLNDYGYNYEIDKLLRSINE